MQVRERRRRRRTERTQKRSRRKSANKNPRGAAPTFAERLSCVRVLLLSSLLLVILLSRKAIRPIAENIEKQKQFVTNAGHEIKTPLAIIQSNTEAMESFKGENKWSKNIKEQTGRLAELMNRMLMLARLEEGNLKPVPVTFALDGLVKELLHGFEQPMEMKQIAWQTELEEAKVCADQMKIGQLISILLDNAVKYTPEQGKIWITVSQIEGQNSIALENCEVSGKMSDTEGASSAENVHNVMVYQSMSGDAEVGTSEFSMTGGTLESNNGDMFYVTNTNCVVKRLLNFHM